MTTPAADLPVRFKVATRLNLPARYNIAPTQTIAVITADEGGKRSLRPMRWGLVPAWAKEVGTVPLFNARLETAADKPSFRGAWRYRHALVPANGWYEWRTQGKLKQPYAVHLPGYAPFAFAALWEVWEGRGEGSWLESATILTTEATSVLADLHHRMPVVLRPEHEASWLDGDPFSADWIADPDLFEINAAARRVGSVANDDPGLLQPDQSPLL